ncbi:MAG: N-6 DNA methylase [Christensenellales bacterium]
MLPAAVKNKIEQIWLDVIAGGVSQPTEVIEQLTYLMFAKQLDEREADIETAELLSGQKQEHIFGESKEEQALRWRNFKGMEARELYRHFIEHVFIFLINLNTDENSAFSRYLKHATFKINEPLALQKVVIGLEDLFENDIKDLDMQGDLYEYMLGKLNSAGRLGAFRTPKHIRDMMVELMEPTPDTNVCDPACGTAGFLISSAEYIRRRYGNKMSDVQWKNYATKTFTGFDTDETMCRLSCMNLMLHSVTNPQLNKQDSVSKDYQDKDKYDLILANPPFKGTINKENINEDLSAITSTTKTELLFVALFVRLLRVGGRCACIVPDGVLFGSSKAHKNLRKELVENQYLEGVISMPSGVFKPYAGVSTAVLIFTKTNSGGTDKVWFYDMKADGHTLDDKRQPIEENDIPDIIERFHNRDGEESRERIEQSFLVDKQEIVDNGYDLSINKYKKIEYVPVEYPPTEEILDEIEELNAQIVKETAELRDLLVK